MIAAVIESCPQPAHRVDMVPSYWRRVRPSALVGSEGWATFGLLMKDMVFSLSGQRVLLAVTADSRGASGSVARMPSTMGSHDIGKPAVAQDGLELGFVDGGLEGQERAQLRVAILLDDEDRRMQTQEALDVVPEREGLDAQVIDVDFLAREHIDRLAHRAVAAADAHDADLAVALADQFGLGHVASRRSRICASADPAPPGIRPNPRCSRRTGCGPSRG